MASPDVTPYVDLTLYDADVQALFDRAKNYVLSAMPDWVPRETNTEVVLMESLALIVSETVFAINRLPNAVAEVLFQMFGITRDIGTYPTFTADVTVIDHSSDLIVPAGYEIAYDLGDGGETVIFTLDAELSFPAGTNTLSGTFTGNIRTTRYNDIPAGTNFTVISPLYYLSSIITTTNISGGGDAESDSEYFQRAIVRCGRLSDALVIPTHFSNYAVEKSYVSTAKTVDLYQAPSGTAGSDYGYVSLFVFGDNTYVSSANRATLQEEIASKSLASVSVSVNDPDNIAVVGVHGTVVKTVSSHQSTVSNAIQASLDSYLHAPDWPWSKVVRWSNIMSLIENTAGVDYVKDNGSSLDLYLTINRYNWNRYHTLSSVESGYWDATTSCTVGFDSSIRYTDVGGSVLVTPTASTFKACTSPAGTIATYGAPVTATLEYFAALRIYIPASQSGVSVSVDVDWYDASGVFLSSTNVGTLTTISGSWITIYDNVTAPASAAYARLAFYSSAATTGQTYYIDAVSISEFQLPNNDVFIDGEAPLVDLGSVNVTVEEP